MFYSTKKDSAKIFYSKIDTKIIAMEFDIKDINIEFYSIRIQWSVDGKVYSDFYDHLDVDNFILDVDGLDELYLGIEVIVKKFHNLDHTFFGFDCKINDYYLNDIFSAKFLNNNDIIVSRRTGNLYDPYRFNENQKILQDKLSRDINEVWGHKVFYFKAIHDEEDIDMTFQQFQKGTITKETYKEFKVMVKNNFVPDNRPTFIELELGYQQEFEIHIDKQVFRENYGDLIPTSDDYFYFPRTKRMYRVNAPYNEKNFMQNDPFWKMICVKWEKRDDIDEDDFVNDEVNSLVDFRHEFNDDKFEDEKNDAVKDEKLPSIDSNVNECNFMVNGNTLFKYYYNYASLGNSKVSKEYEFLPRNNEFTYHAWMKLELSGKNIMEFIIHKSKIITLTLENNNVVISLETIDTHLPKISKKSKIEINKNKWYGYGVSFMSNNVVLSLYDSNLKLIDVVKLNGNALFTPQVIKLFGGVSFANVRVNKKYILDDTIIKLSDKLVYLNPLNKENYIIDNAVPELKE